MLIFRRPLLLAGCFSWLLAVSATPSSAEAPLAKLEYAIDKDVFYLPSDEPAVDDYAKEQCRLDFYRPVGVKDFPTVVYYHGGGLTGGKRSLPSTLKNLGWGVVTVSYRLSPKVQHPTYIEDAAAALAWTFKNVAKHGGDPNKIFVTGISAGGYLTAVIGLDKSYLAKHEIDANQIAGLIPVTGQMVTHATIRGELEVPDARTRPTIDKYAPLYHVRADAPPTLAISGGWEVDMNMRAEENLYFVSMMKLVGHKNVRHVVIEGANHGQCGAKCWPHVIEFVEKTLAAK